MTKPSHPAVLKRSLLALYVLCFTVFAQGETEAVKDFNARVNAYMELQKRVSSNVPPLAKTETDPAKIAVRTKALANGIQQARAHAKLGEVFSPLASQEFRQIIQVELHGRAGAPSREAVKTGNPAEEKGSAEKVVLAVNAPYPAAAPRSSVPPSLLLNLPQLPMGLEYRFLGRHLILLDSMANLIVDYLPDVVPKSVRGGLKRPTGLRIVRP
jgi:hypothetical protein